MYPQERNTPDHPLPVPLEPSDTNEDPDLRATRREAILEALPEKLKDMNSTNLTKMYEIYKKHGDFLFKTVNHKDAIFYYTVAIACRADEAIVYANRSLAHFKLENYQNALEDGLRSIEIDANYIKGHYRVGVCYLALRQWMNAIDSFTQILELRPHEPGVRQQLVMAKKCLREDQFADAISGGSEDECDNDGGRGTKKMQDYSGASILQALRHPYTIMNPDNSKIPMNPYGTPVAMKNIETDPLHKRLSLDNPVLYFARYKLSGDINIDSIDSKISKLPATQRSKPWAGPKVDLSIDYLDENLYNNTQQPVYCDDTENLVHTTSKKYPLELIKYITQEYFVPQKAHLLPKIMVQHIIRDFSLLNSTFPTVIDYTIDKNASIEIWDEEIEEFDVINEETKDTGSVLASNDNTTIIPTKSSPNQSIGEDEDDDMKPSPSPNPHGGDDESRMEKDEQTNVEDDSSSNSTPQPSQDSLQDSPVKTDESSDPTTPQGKTTLVTKKNLRTIAPKLRICGDTHGQFYDVLNIFRLHGEPSINNPYLFNGDFVDRGSFGYELMLTLMLYKLHCPLSIHLTRGNHETLSMNRSFGFMGEVLHKTNQDYSIFEQFTISFNTLPLAYVISGKVLVLHGGLPTSDSSTLNDLRMLNRFCQPDAGQDQNPFARFTDVAERSTRVNQNNNLMIDTLWSDPSTMHYQRGRRPSPRGAGCLFGADVTEKFCEQNDLQLIIRSHEMKHQGYEVVHNNKLITVFSAPHYIDAMNNRGALVEMKGDLTYVIKQFDNVPHPPVRAMIYADQFLRG